jgi:hypothetical protein
MMLRNKRAVIRAPGNPVLNINDRKKFSAFVALLVQIDKRINANGKTANKAKLKKTKDALLGQYIKGSQSRGPFLLFIITLSCMFDRFIINIKAYINDRYSSSSSFFRYV